VAERAVRPRTVVVVLVLGQQPWRWPGSAREAVNDMLEAALLDDLMERVDAGG
jgi:hypothetical protein